MNIPADSAFDPQITQICSAAFRRFDGSTTAERRRYENLSPWPILIVKFH
jgi:hypothetical protein